MEYLNFGQTICDKCNIKLKTKVRNKITLKILKDGYFYYEYTFCPICKTKTNRVGSKITFSKDAKEVLNARLDIKTLPPAPYFDGKEQVNLKKFQQTGYYEYLNSEEWKKRKKLFYSKHKRKCVRCGSRKQLNLHHITYSSLGFEQDKHLACLCKNCHKEYHKNYKHNDIKGFNLFVKEAKQIKRLSKKRKKQGHFRKQGV